jgi:hypothetical protein
MADEKDPVCECGHLWRKHDFGGCSVLRVSNEPCRCCVSPVDRIAQLTAELAEAREIAAALEKAMRNYGMPTLSLTENIRIDAFPAGWRVLRLEECDGDWDFRHVETFSDLTGAVRAAKKLEGEK